MSNNTAADLIRGALRRINSYQSGEQIAPLDAQDALDTLNDLLDSLSLDEVSVFGSVENIVYYTPGQNQYTIGNPTCTQLGEPPFIGALTGGSPTITAAAVPSDLKVGATLTDSANVIPAGTTVLSIVGTTVTMSANASATPANGNPQITYTVPGDFAIARPLRITNGFTRLSNLDFTIEVTMDQSRYLSILYKAQPGPWPTVAWYNPAMPYGVISFYQTPGNVGECHLFTDTILGNLTMNQTFILPQGYSRALKWLLAQEICAEYGYPLTEAIKTNAASAMGAIKALNEQPAVVSRYDSALSRGPRGDYGGILYGWYR